MESGLTSALMDLYRDVHCQDSVTSAQVRIDFSKTPINEPLIHNSLIFGKVPMNRHILEQDIDEDSIEEIFALVK